MIQKLAACLWFDNKAGGDSKAQRTMTVMLPMKNLDPCGAKRRTSPYLKAETRRNRFITR